MNWINAVLLFLVVALNIADLVLTVLSLRAGATELNTLIVWLAGKLGTVPALVLIKVLLIGILLAVSFIAWQTWYLTVLLVLAVIVYAYVVVSNVKVYRSLIKRVTSSS
jgi:hypothetical protein